MEYNEGKGETKKAKKGFYQVALSFTNKILYMYMCFIISIHVVTCGKYTCIHMYMTEHACY